MSAKKPFSPRARVGSFIFALRGLAHVVKTEHNMRIHLAICMAVIVAGGLLGIARTDWLWLIMCMVVVLCAEAFNTAIEILCDVVSPQQNDAVQKAKDTAAGAVLIAAFGSAIIGATLFWPYLFGAK